MSTYFLAEIQIALLDSRDKCLHSKKAVALIYDIFWKYFFVDVMNVSETEFPEFLWFLPFFNIFLSKINLYYN